MPTEFQPTGQESNERSQAELEQLGKERLEELAKTPEAGQEQDPQDRVEAARELIHQNEAEPEPVPAAEAPKASPSFAAHLDRVLNYRQTLASVQCRLSPASRAFSRVIHIPVVEQTSEVLESTVMRPSVVAGGLWSALLVGLVFYLIARFYGFQLSGSEMIAALIAGAVIGLVFEQLVRMFGRSRSRQ